MGQYVQETNKELKMKKRPGAMTVRKAITVSLVIFFGVTIASAIKSFRNDEGLTYFSSFFSVTNIFNKENKK